MIILSIVITITAVTKSVFSFNQNPVKVNKCQDHEWIVRNYIVYVCINKPNTRELIAIGCDPTNGVNIKNHKAPVFPGGEWNQGNGFIYHCSPNKTEESLTWKATDCFWDGKRMKAGDSLSGKHGFHLLCYQDLDGLLRVRIKHNIHNRCESTIVDNDLNCKVGITQTILNSSFGSGDGYQYSKKSGNPVGRALSRATEKVDSKPLPMEDFLPKNGKARNLQLLSAIQGVSDNKSV